MEKRYREALKKQGLSETEIEKTLVVKRERRTSKTLSEISENSKIRYRLPLLAPYLLYAGTFIVNS